MSESGPVLVSWIAVNNDPFERERGSTEFRLVNGERIPGPTLGLLFDEDSPFCGKVNDVVFLYRVPPSGDGDRERLAIEQTTEELRNRAPNINVWLEEWPGEDPTDHQGIFGFLKERLPVIRRRYVDRELLLHISPGTPSMQTVWVLMVETGFVQSPCRMVKSYRRHERRGRPPVVPVELGIETFYKAYQMMRPGQVGSEEQDLVWDPQRFRTDKMRRLFEEARRFSQLKVPVLLLGERGTGKTTIARWMRASSPFRKPSLDQHWPAVACGQYTSETLASELFGHLRGAFTGAINKKDGLLAKADGDTLFLDEIGDLSGDNQRRIIKAVEEKSYYPVGGEEPKKSDFRLLSATNLEDSVLRERLDLDFLDRISPLTIYLPPLREIPAELDWLWESSFRSATNRAGVSVKQASFAQNHHQKIITALKIHPLPGNMRDLFRIAYRILAVRNDPHAPMSPEDAVEYGLLALEGGQGLSMETTMARAVAKAFADGQPLDRLFESVDRLDTAEVQAHLKVYLANEIRRISSNTGEPIEDLCDQSDRTLRNWVKLGGGGKNDPGGGTSDPGTGESN